MFGDLGTEYKSCQPLGRHVIRPQNLISPSPPCPPCEPPLSKRTFVVIQAQSTKDYASILQPPDTQTAKKVPNSRLLLRFQCMPLASPIAENSQEVVSSEHPQLLIVCLLLGLIFCGGIVLYTNQV